MKLLQNVCDSPLEVITEANTKGSSDLFIEGIYIQTEVKNKNGRIYPRHVMAAAVDRYINEQVSKKRSVGELNHPDGPNINLDKVSHLITDLRWEGVNVIGKAKILNTPMGIIARGLIEGGVQLGVSSRGMGSVDRRDNTAYVREDFILNTVDIVQDPSCAVALVNGINEGADWVLDSATGDWKKQQINNLIKESRKSKKIDEDSLIKEFKNIIFGM
jgi:hypothetical protein